MTIPTIPIRDIMRRTIVNLKFIEQCAKPDGPYEVTQLVNSFLGALAHPWEEMQSELMALPLTEAARRGWPIIAKESPTDREPQSLGDLTRVMRNGFTHGNIHFLGDAKGEIQALHIWNTDPRSGERTWAAIISVEAARTFLLCFAALIDELHERQANRRARTA
jgi:hypothetical protein